MGRLLGVSVVVVALLAACGRGSSTLSGQEFAKRADTLCTQYAADLKKLGAPQTLPGLAAFTDKAVPLGQKLIDDTKRLKPPRDEAATVAAWNAENQRIVDAIRALGTAARKGDHTAAQAALRAGDAANVRSNALGRQLGMSACTKK